MLVNVGDLRKGSAASTRVSVIGPSNRTGETGQTMGMLREQAVTADDLWAGYVRTDAGMISGWTHRGDYDSIIYVLTGAMRIEYGPGGKRTVEGHPGDFLFVPKGAVHRESNPSDAQSEAVVFRTGTGAPVVNVDEPRSLPQ